MSEFTPLLQTTSMVDVLDKDGPYTLFAPTNAAFNLMKENQLNYLKSEEVSLYLTHYIILLYYIISHCIAVQGDQNHVLSKQHVFFSRKIAFLFMSYHMV